VFQVGLEQSKAVEPASLYGLCAHGAPSKKKTNPGHLTSKFKLIKEHNLH